MRPDPRSFLVALIVLGAASCAGPAPDPAPSPGSLAYDRGVFTELLEEHAKIRRGWREIDGGVEALTESEDPKVAELIQNHVLAMQGRIESGRRLRQWDPLYVAVFDHAEKISLKVEKTPRGVRITETSPDPAVANLIRAHAGVVTGFADRGFDESAKAHPVPAGAAPVLPDASTPPATR